MILNVINVINQCHKMSGWWHLWFTTRWKVGCSSENRKYAGKSQIFQGSSYFCGSYGSVQVQVLVEDVLKMSWDRRGVVCSWAQSSPAPCICKLKLEAGTSFILILLLCPLLRPRMRPGAGQQANTLFGYIRDCCAKYVNLKKLTLNLSRCIIEGELMDFELNAEEILDGIYYY